MYNRYIPQSDGSFRRSHVPDRPQPQQSRQHPPEPAPQPKPEPVPCKMEPVQQILCPPVCPCGKHRSTAHHSHSTHNRQPEQAHCKGSQEGNVLSFLRNLLPRDFDTGDLLVVILLLLMAGDCQEDQNSALLTLVLYLFL